MYSLKRCVSVTATYLTYLAIAVGITVVTAYAESIPPSGCPDSAASLTATEADTLMSGETLLNYAQEALNRGDLACGEKFIQRVNRNAASTKDADTQARVFFLVKDMLLTWFTSGPSPVDQKVKLTKLGQQHDVLSHPVADDVFSDIVFLVKSAEIINNKGASCEGAKLYLEAAKLEERLPADHNRYIEWQGLQEEFERDTQGWCFREIAGIAKVVTNTHPDIKVNKIMSRIVYYGLPTQIHLLRKTEPNLVQSRLASVYELKKYFDDSNPFEADCLFCGKDARPIMIGRLESVMGFLEMAQGDTDKAQRYFDKASSSYGSSTEATSRSWHRLVLASQVMWGEMEPDYAARLMLEARTDVLAIENAVQRSERTRMYNTFSNSLRGEFMKKNKPVPKELVPIPPNP